MGRTNYSLNELLNAVTKRAFNRYTSQTVDYQHLEAATTKTGLVSNRREYSSASILADTFSLNATNIAESNYDPFLKTFVNNLIDRKTFQIGGSSNTDQFSYAIACTDDRRFLAVTSKFNNTVANEVRVYEFDESLVEQFELTSSGAIDISGNAETFDVDITNDGSETFVAKKVGTTQVVVDKFDQDLNSVSSTTLMTTSLALTGASINVSEYGGRVAVTATSDHPYLSLFQHLFLRVYDNLNTNEYYSLYFYYEVFGTPLALMSKNGRIVVVQTHIGVHTFEIPSASPSGVVSLSPVQTQSISMNHFDLSHDGKVMLTHSGSDVLIYTWNGLQWKQFGQNIPTGLTQVYSSAISYYADYFVVASDDQIKVFKWNRNSTTFEQYGNTLIGDFGTTGQTTRINTMGNTVVIGNSQTNSNSGRSSTYLYDGERWGIINEINGSTTGDALGKFLRVSNNGDKVVIGSTNEVSVKASELVNKSSGWKQRGNTLITDTIDDGFGKSLSMSNDGNYLAVGVPDSITISLNGQRQGSVKIYRFSGGRWSLFGEEILGDGPVDFGKYVSISLDGTKVAVGSDKNSVVKVYNGETNTIPSSSVVDTITLTPEDSTLEMSDDGNRLLTSLAPTTTILQGLTVVSTSTGNKYSLDGVTQPTLRLQKGVTYTGIASTFTETGSHPLRISASPDGTHAGDSTIIASVVGGNLLIPTSASDTLYYFCVNHPDMGGTIQIEPVLSIWDKNDAGVWGKCGGLTEGDVIHLSNNGNYLSVDYSNTARLYEIDSNGQISKIGDDITLSVVSSPVNTFRSNQPTHINTTTSNSGVLSLASYESTSLGVEIASLTWDSTVHPNLESVTQSSEITRPLLLDIVEYGIVLSRNGETLVVYEDTQFRVYTYDDTQWNLRRTSTTTCYNVAISYDGTVLAYEGSGNGLFIQNAVSGASMGSIDAPGLETFAFRNNSYLVVCVVGYTQNILFYSYTGGTTWTLDAERANGSNFTEVHAQFSGDENRLVIGDVYNSRVKIYEYDTDTTSFNTFIQSGSEISSSTNQVVSGNGNVRVVSYPFAHVSGWFESGYVGIYEKDGNGDWPSTESAVLHGFDFQNWGRSIDISEDGSRIVFNSNTSVYVYHKSGGTWTPLGSSFSGSTTTVAISGDGTKIFNGSATSLHSYQLVSGNWVTYLPTVTTDGNITKIQSSSSGDDIAVEQSSYGGRVYSKQTVSFSELGSSITSIGYNETGSAVAISSNGSRVVIGEYTHDSSRGRVRVFDWNGSLWTQVGADIDGEESYDYSGWSVAMSSDGSRIAIGATYNYASGHVRVYDWNGSSWTQVGADIDGEAGSDQSGYSVAMSSDGSRVVIGAPYNGGNGTYSGHVRVYDWNGSSWGQVGADIDAEASGDYSGWSVATSSDGSRVVIGARYNDGNGTDSGHVRVYDWNGSSWTQVGADIDGEVSSDYSGWSVAMSSDGSRIAIGAPYNDINMGAIGGFAGHVRVYDWNGSSWTQVGADIDGEASYDQSGRSVAMSSDGSRVVIGAPYNRGNGTYSGHVRVYDWNGSIWTQVGADIDGETQYDYSGWSVAMSSDGSRFVVGARGGSGRVSVFQFSTPDNPIYNYELSSSYSGSMIDISNDGNTVVSYSDFNSVFALSGDGTKVVSYANNPIMGRKILLYSRVNSAWTKTHELEIDYTPTDFSINTDGSHVGSLGGSTARFYDVGVVDLPNGWTLHSFIDGGGNTLEKFGSIVDISNDGNTVLVGAPGDGTSSYRGYIKVYDYVSSAWTARLTISPTNPDSSTTTGSTTVSVGYRNFGKSASLSSNGDKVSYIEDEETVISGINISNTITMTGDTLNYGYSINTTYNGGDFGSVTYTTAQQTSGSPSSPGSYFYYSMVAFNATDSGIWLPVTFDRSWSVSFTWWSNSPLDFVFYAPNQPSTKDHTQHGGFRIIETLTQRSIISPTGATLASTSVSYPQSNVQIGAVYGYSWSYGSYVRYYTYAYSGQRTVYISYVNGTITAGVAGYQPTTVYTFTGSDLTAQQALWGTQTYIGICSGSGHVYNINVSTSNTTRISELSVRDIAGGTVSDPSPVVDFSERRELSALSMSEDGTRIGVRTAAGPYDALVRDLERAINGWTLRGSIIQFTAPSDIASSSLRALVSSSDGNTIAFGMNTAIKVYGFSNNAWSQLGSDIVPGVTNPSEISIDLSSDGTTLAVLIDRTTSDPAVCKVFTFSSGSWSQSGSSIDFGPTGTNKVKISGDGTTIALGNNTPDSPYPFNVIRVYRKGQDWELISPTMTANKTPTNFFGAGLNLTNNGTKLATFNTSGVEFYTFSTQAVIQYSQYLNDITVSGTTVDVGDIHLSDNGDTLTVLAGDETVRVYDSNHNEEAVFGSSLSVHDFSITKDASSLVLSSDAGTVQVFNYDTSWSQLGSSITTSGGVTTDIKSDGNSIVLVSPNQDLRLYKYESGSWTQASTSTGTRGTSVFISDSDDVIVGDNTNVGRVKTFEIKGVFQDISFTAPTLKLNGDEYIRLNSGSIYVENGATVSTSAAITPTLKISGSVLTREPSVYTIKYEVEDLQRKKADPIFRSIEVIPEVSPIKLEGAGVIYHTQGTSLEDPGVTASVPVSVYHTTPGSSVVVSGFPNFLTATTLGEYKIFYTNDSPDKYLRPSSLVKRSIFVRARPVLTLTGASIVYNPLNQTYVDSGVTFTQTGETSPTVSVSFNAPRVAVSETQTVTYTAKDQFGIEAIPITRQVIVRKRPTITTSGTLYRILNDPISIPAPTVFPETLSGAVQTSNNINRYQLGSYSITYNVTDGDGISANTTRQQYEVGSYGKVTFSQSGTVSAFSRDGRSLAIFSTNVQLYKLGVDGSWESNGSISTPAAVSSMKFSYDGRYIVIGMSSHFTVGLVTVYKENPLFENNWEQLGLDLFGTDYLGKFGHVVEINDFATHIFIGAPEANTNSGALFKAGFVKIYKWNGVFWEEEKIVEGLGPAELLGTSISISRDGSVLAIGSPGYTRTTIAEDGDVTSANVGKTSIYRYVDNVWESYGGTDIDDGTEGGRNAFSLSMTGDGKRLAVGSESGGGVRVYTIQGSRWSPFGSHIPGTFGKSVSLSDENVLIIGSDNESSGRAYVYNLKGDWSKTGTTFDQVIVAPSALNDMGKQVNVNASSTFVCIDSETEVRIYSI